MVHTLVLWAFLYGVANHGTQGAGGSVTTFDYESAQACDTALKKAVLKGQLGAGPYALYEVVGQCVEHPRRFANQ
jgi:hypothetical protein